jgi:hypothetical protein
VSSKAVAITEARAPAEIHVNNIVVVFLCLKPGSITSVGGACKGVGPPADWRERPGRTRPACHGTSIRAGLRPFRRIEGGVRVLTCDERVNH